MTEPGVHDADRAWRRTIEDMYSDEVERFYEQRRHLVDESLHPRGPQLFFDVAGELGLDPTSRALDVGCRDGRHLAEVEARFGCRVTGLEPAAGNLARMHRRFGARRFMVARGVAEALPFADCSFDLVWVRDVLVHVKPLTAAFAECRRVKKPDAPVLVYHVCATDMLEPQEAARLWADGGVVADNADRVNFEQAITAAGLRIEHREDLHGEWQEYTEENDGGAARRLLRVSRLLRRPDHYRALLGDRVYRVEVGDCLYGVYQMIGKLNPTLYVLR
jgi:ubiquinone/menaquinone biosynthesis C-methylase UbiE